MSDAACIEETAASVDCSRCRALCCRLTVVLDAADRIAPHLTEVHPNGYSVMARNEDGFCVALGADDRCSIYASRPQTCRRFVMGGPYCLAVREDERRPAAARTIGIVTLVS